ncbi:hypothetical protein CLTEP_22930 [Clostridium tepidiprofundi DSM 19306]|uniref:Phosphatidylglycerol lysyltransferase n=1 Tax=Clostridium tepidiprofundi DSM 19306 TaxID=1121338 RepID=A0A151AWN4_9CLOT|nr:lysylphosphatidylglycerol synthase transmembrane domain-containing protein [Clostridium tepidiprofundi]KYH32048.1 hypothetical protein CLTEP_22930 [Clostridium tepidiprofundi DSM 19306]
MNKTKFNLIVGLSSGIIFVVLIILTHGWTDLIHQLSHLNLVWIILGFSLMVLYWIFESKTLHVIIASLNGKYKFTSAFKVTMMGQFFNSITPFATGGQPAQLYGLTKEGIETGTAGSILMIKFIIYQSTLTIYSLVLILWKTPFFTQRMSHLFYLILLGFTVNTSVIVFLIVFSSHRGLTHKFVSILSKILIKLNIVKDIEKFKKSIDDNLEQFHEDILIIKDNKMLMLKSAIFTTLQLTAFFTIPYCIYRSFGMNAVKISNMIAANSFVIMLTSFVPLPGAVGGAEGGFYMFFSLFFSKKNIMSAILLWRLLTFYSCIIFGSFAVMNLSSSEKLLEKKN